MSQFRIGSRQGLWRRLLGLTLLIMLTFSLASTTGITTAQDSAFLRITGTVFSYRGQPVYLRGSNIGNIGAIGIWQTPNIDDIEPDREDYFKLKEMGGNHFRFGMSLPWYNQDRNKFWRVLDQQVAWAKEAGVWLVPLLFVTEDNCYEGYNNTCKLWTDAAQQERLIAFWVEMARHYRDEPTVIGFDFLNEPTPPGPGWCDTWFTLAQRIRDGVAAINPQALAFIEACADGQFYHRFEGDNIVYEVHFYEPLAATHNEDGSAVYPGSLPDWDGKQVYWSKDAFRGNGDERADIRNRLAINWAKEQNVPIYVGEWGTRSPYQGWETYLTDIASLLNEWHIHWSHYTWRHLPGYWDTFGLGHPLVVQNPATYTMLTWALLGKLGPDDPDPTVAPTMTAVVATATPRWNATLTRVPPTILATVTTMPMTSTWQPSLTPHPRTPEPTQNDEVVVRYSAAKTEATSSTIEFILSVINTGEQAIDLGEISLRYYFKDQGSLGDYAANCEVADIGCERVQLWFGQLAVARDDATHYLEVGFGKGSLGVGEQTGDISLQIHRSSWHDLNQADDYSFNPQQTKLSPSDKVTAYRQGRLIWGSEPGMDPHPRPSPGSVRVLYMANPYHRDASSSVISPEFAILNATGEAIRLSHLKLRYYFTRESTEPIVFTCAWAQVGCDHLTAQIGREAGSGSDYLELGFTDAAGDLEPNTPTGPISVQLRRADWTDFNQADDYSFRPDTEALTTWDRVTLYKDAAQIWGLEPGAAR
ncbi:MAG: cellulase family glycosylhydrolase [Anaerolineae bacterium]|nr:cellulase family glycosylhydrolase [Anaerolineae bacterium]